jgi:tetratricopeptide (TPR) repeat protein
MANHSLEDRRSNLSDRMSNGREDWQQHRQDMQNDRQDWRDNNREDWQNWGDNKLDNYGDWYHGGWYPGAGWGYMWDNYPVAAAIGMTGWAVNRIGYGWGYYDYSNPYYSSGGGYGYDYSQPLVVYADAPTATATTTEAPAAPASSTQPQPSDEGMAAFDQARAAFQQGDYAGSLSKLEITLKTMPNDTVVHEFRGLVLFALKKYPESAAAIYAVLSAGPGWDWTTMISLYPSAETYTTQVRALEDFVKANPKSPDGHFLIAYHYQTMGHAEAAAKQFKDALTLLPEDKLLKQLVAMTAPQDKTPKPATTTPPPAVGDDKTLKAEQLVGNWTATAKDSSFELNLAENGGFTWTFTKEKRKQSVKGVFAVDQNNLALETDDGGGTMLAEVTVVNPSTFKFKMIGDDPKDPGLEFKKK